MGREKLDRLLLKYIKSLTVYIKDGFEMKANVSSLVCVDGILNIEIEDCYMNIYKTGWNCCDVHPKIISVSLTEKDTKITNYTSNHMYPIIIKQAKGYQYFLFNDKVHL